jgi:2-polyprenyl-3-methyl-5-hydroxy-6-metoxy-1,4-benzoquinol methylase
VSDAFTQATGRGLEDDAGANQRRYKAYQLELMRPYFGSSLLEVGAGLGEFAAQVTGLRRHVVTDVDAGAVASMASRFAGRAEVEARVLDLAGDLREQVGEPVATVLAINVLEHIEDDAEALRRMAALTQPGGMVVIWVPG